MSLFVKQTREELGFFSIVFLLMSFAAFLGVITHSLVAPIGFLVCSWILFARALRASAHVPTTYYTRYQGEDTAMRETVGVSAERFLEIMNEMGSTYDYVVVHEVRKDPT